MKRTFTIYVRKSADLYMLSGPNQRKLQEPRLSVHVQHRNLRWLRYQVQTREVRKK